MKRHAAISMIFIWFILLTVTAAWTDDSGTFRGKWWNYYDRGLESAEKGEWEKALTDLRQAITMRQKDQRNARTYGMHFVEYFPHRELGIIYFTRGETDLAIKELQESVNDEESAKAIYYLNRARKSQLLNLKGGGIRPPIVTFETPSGDSAVRTMSVNVRGRATGEGLVSKIVINGEPFRFDLADREVSFEKEVQVSDGTNQITVVCEDLIGNSAEKTAVVTVDREGPGISVYEVNTEERAGEKFIRITGVISDVTGIRKVVIGGQQKQLNGEREYAFDVSLEKKMAGDRIIIQAVDSLDNDTEAEIDIKKDLIAFGRLPEPVLLAFNTDRILSFDKEQPVLKLREAGELPVVFIDRYYVEGEAFDNKGIEKILINGAGISSGKGKKVFFSKMVKLNKGKNKIVVEAFDGSGNKAATELSVNREVPAVMQVGARMSISVLPFDVPQKGHENVQLAYDFLIGSFLDQNRFSVVERAKLEQVLQEQKLTKARLTDPEHSIRIGKLVAANAIISTTVKDNQKSIEIVSRVIDTETSEVMALKDVFTEDRSLTTIKDLMEGLSAKIASSFPLIDGMVINKEREVVFADFGGKAKVRKNAGVLVYRKGKEIKHPVTGKSLGFDTVRLGEGRIEDIQNDFSKIRILDKPAPQEIHVKDLIVTK
jgi:hypothetical protein